MTATRLAFTTRRARRLAGARDVRIVAGAARFGARRMSVTAATALTAATLLAARAPMLGPSTRILVRLVLGPLAVAFGTRGMRTFLDLELGRLDELDLLLEQLLDVTQVAQLIG